MVWDYILSAAVSDPSRGWLDTITDSLVGTPITRTYDNLDLLTSESTPQGTVSYFNDSLGRRSTMTVAGQPTMSYCYDNADRLTQMTQGTCQTPQSPTVSVGYDTAGRRSSLTLPNGIVATYGYDVTTSRLTSINYDKSGTHVGDLSYGYDAIGRRTSMGGTLARVNLPAAVSSATYNVNNQLTNWAGTTLSYDLNGSMTSDSIRSFTWNARNQLTMIGTTTFRYDGVGRRSQNGAGVSFVYDGLNPVQEQVGGAPRANLLTGGLDEFFARTDSGGTSSFLTDALGSTLALADSTGTVQTQYTFDPFGNTTSTGASSTSAFQYTGRENDGSGLYYYRARFYNATLQRFISEDPLGFSGGDANFCAYAGDDRTDFEDPLGLMNYKCALFGVCSQESSPPKLASRAPSGPSGSNGGARSADFLNLTISAGPGFGGEASLSLDRTGHLYFGIGPQFGKSLYPVAVSLTGNWLDQYQIPTRSQLDNYLGKSNVTGIVAFGVAAQQGWWPGSGAATGIGVAIPQIGVGYTYSWDLGKVGPSRYW